MPIESRLSVIISSPKVQNLSNPQRRFLEAVEELLRSKGLRILTESADSDTVIDDITKTNRCRGVLVLAFEQWNARRLNRDRDKDVVMPSEFTHIKAVTAAASRRPLLVLREKSLADRGVLRGGYLQHVVRLPNSLKTEWLDGTEFQSEFKKWRDEIDCFRHVFLGYSSQASETGEQLCRFLSDELKLRVFDWHNFHSGDSIWESIVSAERYTNCGVFLFMADDALTAGTKAPRDNVVYEAGYFAGAKGGKSAVIVMEEGAKVPTDLQGILYLKLGKRRDIAPIKEALRERLQQMLGAER
ncbi:MAG TPA: TIR domain-containing protein [Candidatus Binatia bacterium]|nr:TIR domain-containing protein [Candidatus Binatia bacterium]